MKETLLEIKNLKANASDKEILKGINLTINKGEVHVIMGPNGAGKSTLANVLMCHPKYALTDGEVIYKGEVINDKGPDERAKRGIFLSFQYPEEVPGITVENFLRASKAAVLGKPVMLFEFRKQLKDKMEKLKIDESYAKRYLNVGFSGGEKKKNEILQMSVLEPSLAILDETDSGLDVDAIRIVSEGVKNFANAENAIVIITHQQKILEHIKPDYVHILVNGKIVKTSDASLAEEIEAKGFEWIK